MLIYRVEHKRYRHGPYVTKSLKTRKCRELSNELCNAHSNSVMHPGLWEDGINDIQGSDYCGFKSLLALSMWFGQWVEKLTSAGYHIAVFKVPDELVREGGRQVVFPRKSFRSKQTLSLETSWRKQSLSGEAG